MRLINAVEISGKILSLLDDAEKELVIISPFTDINACEALMSGLKKAIGRGVTISLFTEKERVPFKCIAELNLRVYYVHKLDSKIYLNEKQGIITSIALAEAPARFSFDYGMQTESNKELEAIKKNFLQMVQRTEPGEADKGKKKYSFPHFKGSDGKIDNQCGHVEKMPVTKMRIFKAHFQKTFRHHLVHNKERDLVTCNHFPFVWTSFEYWNSIKITLELPSCDLKKFRLENIDEFKEIFGNHQAYWNYPYDNIQIYGDETSNGINPYDINCQLAYITWLIKEVTKFLQTKEEVLLRTPLYRITESCLPQ